MATFLAIVVALGFVVSLVYDNPVILYAAIIFSIVMNVGSYWFSDKISLALAGAKPINLQDGHHLELHRLVENLSIAAGLPTPRVYIIEDPAPNAFATGRNKEHAAVAVTTGLLAIMERSELEGVLAHELAHIGNKDILLSSVIVVLVGFVSIIADIFLRSMWFGGGRSSDNKGANPLMIIGIIFIVLSPIMATLIQLAISRRREYLADASGALITRYPEGLASALEKIGGYGRPMARASNAMAHLYISNPFGARAVKGMAGLFMTHPPIEKRIALLRDGHHLANNSK